MRVFLIRIMSLFSKCVYICSDECEFLYNIYWHFNTACAQNKRTKTANEINRTDNVNEKTYIGFV